MKECACVQCAENLSSRVEHYECPRCHRFGTLDEFSPDRENCFECEEAADATANA